MKKKEIHPRWRDDGKSLSVVVSNPPKKEVEELNAENVRLIENMFLNSETDEKLDGKNKK